MLRELTTLGVGGAPAEFHVPRSTEELVATIEDCRRRGRSWRALGRGSNLVVDDRGIDDAVIHTAALRELEIHPDGRVIAGAGLPTGVLEARARAEGLGGLECLVGYPATIGGAARMNAGGRWGEIGARIEAVVTVDRQARVRRITADECAFRYRGSSLGESIVAAVELRLPRVDLAAYRARTRAIHAEKAAVQPLDARSAGCIFRNPDGVSAGRLVDELALKGHRRGDAQISERHGNFLVNVGRAGSDDVLRLIDEVRDAVAREFGIDLVREVEVWR